MVLCRILSHNLSDFYARYWEQIVQRIVRQDITSFAFVAIGLLSLLAIWWAFAYQPTQVAINVSNPMIAQGTLGRDPEGVWFTGDTQINSNRFGNTPWRAMQWRWRQAPGTPLVAKVQLAAVQLIIPVTESWRVVHILMPSSVAQIPLIVQSTTVRVPGDSRDLGVIMGYLTVHRLMAPPWWIYMVVGDYGVLIVMAALWLWRGRWLGVIALVLMSVLYLAMVIQETASGFANPTLWLDHNSRYVLSAMAGLFTLAQRQRVVVALTPRGRLFGLDIMRAVAITGVVIAHSTPLFFEEWSTVRDIFKWFVGLGGIGVDIFFALSGYLIGAILLRAVAQFNQAHILKRFLMRRWLRTLPAAYVSAIMIWFIAAPQNIPDYITSMFFMGAINPLRFSGELTYWWSLAIEEIFYLVFPIMLFLLIKKFPQHQAFLLTIGIMIGVSWVSRIILIAYLAYSPVDYGLRINHISYANLDLMVLGIVLQLIRQQRPDWFVRLSHIGFAPGAVVFVTGVILLLDPLRWELVTIVTCHLLITIGSVLMIPACESLVTLGWRRIDDMVRWIALISYSLYLYNCLVAIFVFQRYGAAMSWEMVGWSLTLYFGLTVLLSALSYYLIEAPVMRWRDVHYADRDAQ
jgi:peptidoglycan/LPS O-acetylase OafA/YrhL